MTNGVRVGVADATPPITRGVGVRKTATCAGVLGVSVGGIMFSPVPDRSVCGPGSPSDFSGTPLLAGATDGVGVGAGMVAWASSSSASPAGALSPYVMATKATIAISSAAPAAAVSTGKRVAIARTVDMRIDLNVAADRMVILRRICGSQRRAIIRRGRCQALCVAVFRRRKSLNTCQKRSGSSKWAMCELSSKIISSEPRMPS